GVEGVGGLERIKNSPAFPAFPAIPALLDRNCLANHALQRPALPPAHRPCFHYGDDVADLRLAVLVVDHETRRSAFGLAVHPVSPLPLDGDHDALLHLVADDHTDF